MDLVQVFQPNIGSMGWGKPLVSLVGLFTLCCMCTMSYNIFFHPLRNFPGPRLAKFSRLPLLRAHFKGKMFQYISDAHAQYGPIVRVAPDELTITHSDSWKDIYQKRPQLIKDPYGLTPPLNGADSLFTAQGQTHIRMRRTLTNAFSDKALRDQSPIVESYITLFVDRIRREAAKSRSKGSVVDLAKYMGYLTLDTISDLAIGQSFHGLEGDNEHSWILGFWLGVKFGSIRTSLSRFHPLELVFGFIFLRLTARERTKNWKLVTDCITRRLGMGDLGETRSDFITPVIGNVNEGKQKGITRQELNTNSLALVIAGCEVSNAALAATTYFLLRYSSTLKRLNEEIRESFQSENNINVMSTMNLPYLSAVINEGLRIHHPTPSQLPRVVPKEGLMIAGHWIPGGTFIGVGLQTIQNHPDHWTEPDVFHPERWLPETHKYYDARFAKDNKEAFRPFSCGPRNCIGWKLFLAEARVTLARLLWNFELQLADLGDWDWPDQRAYLVFEPKPLNVIIRKRVIA